MNSLACSEVFPFSSSLHIERKPCAYRPKTLNAVLDGTLDAAIARKGSWALDTLFLCMDRELASSPGSPEHDLHSAAFQNVNDIITDSATGEERRLELAAQLEQLAAALRGTVKCLVPYGPLEGQCIDAVVHAHVPSANVYVIADARTPDELFLVSSNSFPCTMLPTYHALDQHSMTGLRFAVGSFAYKQYDEWVVGSNGRSIGGSWCHVQVVHHLELLQDGRKFYVTFCPDDWQEDTEGNWWCAYDVCPEEKLRENKPSRKRAKKH